MFSSLVAIEMRQTWHNQPTNQQHTVTLVKYIYIFLQNIYQHTTSGGWWWGDSNQKKRGTAATTSSLDAVRSPTGDGQWQPAPLNVAENSQQQQPTHTHTRGPSNAAWACSTSRFADDAVKKSPLARHLLAVEKQSKGNAHTQKC
jgi:hypothetical protein